MTTVLHFPLDTEFRVGQKLEVTLTMPDTGALVGKRLDVSLIDSDTEVAKDGIIKEPTRKLQISRNGIRIFLVFNNLGEKGEGKYRVRFTVAGTVIDSPSFDLRATLAEDK